jgi:hypothetical protein
MLTVYHCHMGYFGTTNYPGVLTDSLPRVTLETAWKEAFDDAISATKAALAEGIVPGSGRSRLYAVQSIENLEATATNERDCASCVWPSMRRLDKLPRTLDSIRE